jgi:hypothetical protein
MCKWFDVPSMDLLVLHNYMAVFTKMYMRCVFALDAFIITHYICCVDIYIKAML